MKRPFVFSCFGFILFSLFASLSGQAQESGEENEFRLLTNKDGRQLQAKIKTISKNRRFLQIVLEDGREANIEIVKLVLEDQQYLRGWYLRQPATEHRVEVAIDKTTARPTERRRSGDSKLNTIFPQYEITVTNLDRSVLTGARLDYYLLYQNRIAIYRNSETKRWDSSRTDPDEDNLIKTYGSYELPELNYNQGKSFVTKNASIDQVIDDEGGFSGEDRLLGVIVRITDRENRTLGVWRSGESGIEEREWAQVAGPESENRSMISESSGAPSGSGRVRRYKEGDRDQFSVSVRPITFFARVQPDKEKPNGIIGSIGGGQTGIALMIQNGEVVFAVRNEFEKLTQVRAKTGIGDAGFLIKATLTKEEISLQVDGQSAVTVASSGLLAREPRLGLRVGYERDSQVGVGYEMPFRFEGAISEFVVLVGDKIEGE